MSLQKNKGKFFVFEGIDGSGKSTIVQKVADELRSKNIKVFITSEPTDNPVGTLLKKMLRKNTEPLTELFLFLADRVEHINEIKNHLKNGEYILCDRYAYSSCAYQGSSLATHDLRPASKEPWQWILEIQTPFLLEPDKVFLLDITPELALERIKKRRSFTHFEVLEFLKMVRDIYHKIAKNRKNWIIIDARKSIKEIVAEVIRNTNDE